jgi:hypothetical protein
MKYIRLAIIVGWFFAFQTDFDDSGAKMSSSIGPFATEGECKLARSKMIEGAEQLGLDAKFTACMFKQES